MAEGLARRVDDPVTQALTPIASHVLWRDGVVLTGR